MAQVTGLTAERMLAIEAGSVVSGLVRADGHLILTHHDGSQTDAGYAWSSLPASDTTQKGVLELATTAEAQAGTSGSLAVPPSALGAGLANVLPSRLKTVNNLGSGKDPNSLTDTGWYSGYSWIGALAGYGIGALMVIQYSPDWITQVFFPIDASNRQLVRSRYSGTTWSPWSEYATKAYVDQKVSDLNLRISGTDTPANPDLNTYTSPGTWSISLTTWAVNGLNFPIQVAGLLEVFTGSAATGHVWQRYTPYGESGDHFWGRQYYGATGWTPWIRYRGEKETYVTGSGLVTMGTGWTFGSCEILRVGRVISLIFNCTRSGAAIASNSTGNITNVSMAVIADPQYRPKIGYAPAVTGWGGNMWSGYIGNNGTIALGGLDPNVAVNTNDVIYCTSTYICPDY